jgi:hypothetical protein
MPAKLLFQFRRSDEPADGGHRRIVERRIVAIDASGPEEAYERALALGAEEEWSGNYGDFDVNFELVGILQMIERTAGDDSELWWELPTSWTPRSSAPPSSFRRRETSSSSTARATHAASRSSPSASEPGLQTACSATSCPSSARASAMVRRTAGASLAVAYDSLLQRVSALAPALEPPELRSLAAAIGSLAGTSSAPRLRRSGRGTGGERARGMLAAPGF